MAIVTERARAASAPPAAPPRRIGKIIGGILFYGAVGIFILNLLGLVGSVVIDSFGEEWFNTWLPAGKYSTMWYTYLSHVHDIGQLLGSTFIVAIATTVIALLIGFPAAYVLARKQFPFKSVLTVLYLVPMLIPPLAYGVPLATLLLKYLGISLLTVIVINLVPVVPFVILILQPFVEQVDVSLESASHMLGANQVQTFVRVVLPLIIPGLLTAGILAVVRTIAMFDLTYLVADSADTQTLITALYADASASGTTPNQAVDGMAVIYMLTTMFLLVIALFFVKPTQFVVRVKSTR